jgi:mRNA-degrading endonuclease RelE of RelBE toxin-antitoxin system
LKAEQARKTIEQLLETKVRFEGHFNKCFDNLKKTQQEQLLEWLRNCKARKTNPIQSQKNKSIIGFVKRFGSNLRAILTKEKQGYFLTLFLDKHKYYEDEMTKLGF